MKKRRAKVHGILLLDKPKGLTSNAALYELKRLYDERKLGHSGSLDPIATGMLVCCFGEATKLSSWLLNADKDYRVEVRLGVRTATGDSEGEVIGGVEKFPTRDQVQIALDAFRGEIEQVPPMYSAVKYRGKALYKLARQGQQVERKPRQIEIRRLELLGYNPPQLELDIHCSKGTYVRVLADDLGELLGCGAHVSALHRNRVHPFAEQQMRTLDELTSMGRQERIEALLPCDAHLGFMAQLDVSEPAAERLRSGNPVPLRQNLQPGTVRLYCDRDGFIGLAEVTPDALVRPKRMLRLMPEPGGSGCEPRLMVPTGGTRVAGE